MSAAIERAKQEVFRICRGGRDAWRMSIPVNLERDSDCLIVAGLRTGEEAERLLREIHRCVVSDGPHMVPETLLEETRRFLYPPATMLGVPITAAERDRISKDGP